MKPEKDAGGGVLTEAVQAPTSVKVQMETKAANDMAGKTRGTQGRLLL